MRRLALAAVAIAIAAGGCGEDDTERATTGETGGREEFVAQVNSVCDEFREELGSIPPPQTPAESREFNVEATSIGERFIDRLEEQAPPDDIRDEYESYVTAHGDVLELVSQLRAAQDQGRQEVASRLQDEIQPASERLGELTANLGLDRCGGSGG
jgi:hypothetical protein